MLFQVQISLNKKCGLFLTACAKLTFQAFSVKAEELLRAEMRTAASSKLIWCADDNKNIQPRNTRCVLVRVYTVESIKTHGSAGTLQCCD